MNIRFSNEVGMPKFSFDLQSSKKLSQCFTTIFPEFIRSSFRIPILIADSPISNPSMPHFDLLLSYLSVDSVAKGYQSQTRPPFLFALKQKALFLKDS